MMRKLNIKLADHSETALVSVRDLVSGRQANNLLAQDLGASIRPWFSDWTEAGDSPLVSRALKELDQPERRERAAAFLGLEIIAA